jgi:response regulator NasT
MKIDKNHLQPSDKILQPVLEKYSVLIVDDDRTMAELLSINLRRAGHRVAGIAWNGREAVSMAFKTRPDAIIMDIHMPVLDGVLAAREILGARLVPIVFSTGMSDFGSIHGATDLQIVSYLVKPFSPAQMNVAIHLAVAHCRRLAELDVLAAA